VLLGELHGLGQPRRVAHLRDTEARPAARRLDEHRPAELRDACLAAGPVGLPVALLDHEVRNLVEPVRRENDLGVVLVHAHRAGEHTGTDVPDAGDLQQALERAVLAVRAVQEREDDIDPADLLRNVRGLQSDHGVVVRVVGEYDLGALLVDLGQAGALDREPVGIVAFEHPAAVERDADRDHVVLVAVDRAEHAAGGHARDGVL
jgi:hypothetical protein